MGHPKDHDIRAIAVVRGIASRRAKEGIFHGQVPNEVVSRLYTHVSLLSKELVPLTGFKAPPAIALSVEKLPKKQLGHYKVGRDGLGLKYRVALNTLWMARPFSDVVRTVLHEILHAVDHDNGKVTKKAHDTRFREWSTTLGIPCDGRGVSEGIIPGSPFALYLERHGVKDEPALLTKKQAGKATGSTLTKWVCQCEKPVALRVGVQEIDVTCNVCGEKFAPAEKKK